MAADVGKRKALKQLEEELKAQAAEVPRSSSSMTVDERYVTPAAVSTIDGYLIRVRQKQRLENNAKLLAERKHEIETLEAALAEAKSDAEKAVWRAPP